MMLNCRMVQRIVNMRVPFGVEVSRACFNLKKNCILVELCLPVAPLSLLVDCWITSILHTLGYSSKLPTEIWNGPEELGGLGLFNLLTELGISTLKKCATPSALTQRQGKSSGILELLLDHPWIFIPYLAPTWITLVWQFLYQHNLSISLTDTIKINLCRPHSWCFMNTDTLSRYTRRERSDINLVHIYLQIITLADMSLPDRNSACTHHLQINKSDKKHGQNRTFHRHWNCDYGTSTYHQTSCDTPTNRNKP